MKRILFLFVVSALFDVASVSAEVPPEMKILPRRVSHIGVTKPEKQSYVLHFSYDGQGRIVAVRRTTRSRRDEGGFRRVGEDDTVKIAYAPDRVTVTDAAGRAVYEVAGGRAVAVAESWYETMEFSGESAGTYSYDGCGYLAGSTFANENVEYAESYKIAGGVFAGMRRDVEGQVLEAGHENDPERLNNLNIDLFGLDEIFFYGNFSPVLLYGIGGRRVRTLPVKIVYRWAESADEPEYRTYEYEMAGEYVAAVEVRDERGGRIRLEFFYEE